MLFLVELKYAYEHREEVLRFFWEHGATRYQGSVALKGAWVATQERIVYALVEAADADEIAQAGEPLAQFGTLTIRQVTSVEDI